MDDLLKKIRDTENQASNIIKDANAEAEKIIEASRSSAAKKTQDLKKGIYKKYADLKASKIEEALKKREEKTQAGINEYISSFGDLEKKKSIAIDYINKKIFDKA
ncbi:MAG TPA: hypothetical protein PK385_02275 [Spirochaetota bacterium]|nr:hypothetical protein [Spirochaetota bacterium]HOS33587.1 hypothetical protein [Spirochaetota bacterium]HOS54864.1 hypothetical protein [Spirochaetota bacterium]HPK62282.1 hypothetical protein [Spirochaetota bacterium]HQF77786.1 hypothetical protein [Spirochaetota bacterium]